MSLATRCAACGTVFRVVQDQLKVSEGRVRCGRCGDVFNALEGLFDLDREATPAWTPSQQSAQDLEPASAHERAVQRVSGDGGRESAVVSEAPDDTPVGARADSLFDVRQLQHGDFDDDAVGRGEGSDFDALLNDDMGPAAAGPAPTPDFLRRANDAARWQRPGVRWALASVASLLGLLLAAQIVLQQRDAIAAHWPQGTPLLALLCEPLGCSIAPQRRLDGLVVDSSGLTQLDNPSLYRLQVALRNRDTVALATPALDVTLTDSRGEVLARKVIGQREFGAAAPATVAAASELILQAVLDAGERRITGYSVEIFYP